MAIDPSRVKRFGHGSRVPGWDEAVDLTKDPAVVPDPATTPVPDELRAEIEAHMRLYPDSRSAAIPALHAVQRQHGWCSPEAIEQAACVMRLTPAYLASVATFYDMLETRPSGEHTIYVCIEHLSCCLARRDEIYAEMLSTAGEDAAFNVRAFECLGACDIAPMASVDGEYVGPLTNEDCATIVADLRAGRTPLEATVSARPGRGGRQDSRHAMKLLYDDIDRPGLNTRKVYEKLGGYKSLRKALKMPAEDVLAELQAPRACAWPWRRRLLMGKKVSFLPKGSMEKYLVCNADESEPGTFKDRELMQKNPHLLIEGMIIAAWAAGANRSFIYIRGEYEHQADILDTALAEAIETGYLGDRILGSDHSLTWSSIAARGPTSAARRPPCSTRWRASAATRA